MRHHPQADHDFADGSFAKTDATRSLELTGTVGVWLHKHDCCQTREATAAEQLTNKRDQHRFFPFFSALLKAFMSAGSSAHANHDTDVSTISRNIWSISFADNRLLTSQFCSPRHASQNATSGRAEPDTALCENLASLTFSST